MVGNVEERRKTVDATVGGLVWVQRRNGCWWPGQIVGLDELSENGSGSPRSGTPIKLLGRDDASVEWYDLETTKVVKAFRCGEYDTCIEKAKVSAPKFLKRSLKYPRREIAIFYALEIEKNSLLKDAPNLSDNPEDEAPVNCENGSASVSHPIKDSKSSSEGTVSENTSDCEENSNSTQELSHSLISYKVTNGSTCLRRQRFKGKKRKSPNDSEDECTEGSKRMKGLNDLGVGSERRMQVLGLANPAAPRNVSLNGSQAPGCTAVETLANGGAVPSLPSYKKKRSQVVHIHELLKRKYRRRPLTKVLEHTTMVPVHIICDEFANPFERSDAVSSANECENGNKVKDMALMKKYLLDVDTSHTLFDVPFVDEDLQPSGFSSIRQSSASLKPFVGGTYNGNSRRNFHVQPSSAPEELDEPGPMYCNARVNEKVEKGASKWQSKGKRRARFLSKNDDFMNSQKKLDAGHEKSDAYGMGLESPGPSSPSSNGLINGFADLRKHISVSTSSPRSFSYHQPRFLFHSNSELSDIPSLFEVDVTVEATRPHVQHVPYISLMSKLSGKPITGHPVAVEALVDGFCDLLTLDHPASGSCEMDVEDAEMDLLVEPKNCKTKHVKLRSRASRRKRKSSKAKKRHGSSSKKTRKLSSLNNFHKLNSDKRKPMVQSSKGPTLACVPLKIVFSRINEALNGSTRSANRAVTLNNT